MTQRIDSRPGGFTPAERVVAGGLILLIVIVSWMWLTSGQEPQATVPPASQPMNVLDMEPVTDEGRMVNTTPNDSIPTTFPATSPTASRDTDRLLLPTD